MRARLRALDPNVRGMGWVSFVADLSSEIVYPLFPLFVTGVLGAPVAVLGLIEGVAEATATVLRYPFGQLSDRLGRRRPFVIAGYGLERRRQAPDRRLRHVGLRPRRPCHRPHRQGHPHGAPRRAHRRRHAAGPAGTRLRPASRHGHDGRRAGPADRPRLPRVRRPVALGPRARGDPGGCSASSSILLFVRERRQPPSPGGLRLRLPASPAYRWLLAGSLLFAAGNSSDMFLLLKAQDVGMGVSAVILVYVLYNLVYATASLPLGGLSDRVGQLPLVLGGYLVFAAVYVGFAACRLVVDGGDPLRRLRSLHRRDRGHEQGAHQSCDAGWRARRGHRPAGHHDRSRQSGGQLARRRRCGRRSGLGRPSPSARPAPSPPRSCSLPGSGRSARACRRRRELRRPGARRIPSLARVTGRRRPVAGAPPDGFSLGPSNPLTLAAGLLTGTGADRLPPAGHRALAAHRPARQLQCGWRLRLLAAPPAPATTTSCRCASPSAGSTARPAAAWSS